MTTYAEIRNSDSSIVRTFQEADTFVAPPQKFGPAKATRIVPVVESNPPPDDQSVFLVVSTLVVSANALTRTWTSTRRTTPAIRDAIEDECNRRIGGSRGLLFMIRCLQIVQGGGTLTAPQQARLGGLNQTAAFAEGLYQNAATITTVQNAAWP